MPARGRLFRVAAWLFCGGSNRCLHMVEATPRYGRGQVWRERDEQQESRDDRNHGSPAFSKCNRPLEMVCRCHTSGKPGKLTCATSSELQQKRRRTALTTGVEGARFVARNRCSVADILGCSDTQLSSAGRRFSGTKCAQETTCCHVETSCSCLPEPHWTT